MSDYFDDWKATPLGESKGVTSVEALPDMAVHRNAIGGPESGNDYSARGTYNSKYGYPLGRYQVMESNLPKWSKEAIGRVVSPQEFLRSPEIQDKIFDTKFGQALQTYGNPRDAASVWFSSLPYDEAVKQGRHDINESVQKYVANYEKGLSGASPTSQPSPQPSKGVEDASDLFGKLYPQSASQTSPQQTFQEYKPNPLPNHPMPAPNTPWNFGNSVISGAGAAIGGPQLFAGGQAVRNFAGNVLQGMPPSAALDIAKNSYFPNALHEYQQQEQDYAKAYPGENLVGNLLGGAAATYGGLSALNKGVGALETVAPRLAQYIGGTAGEGMAGMPGFATRLGSAATAGAIQGAVANAVNGQSPGQGAIVGAAASPLGSMAANTLGLFTRATARPEVAAAAQDALNNGLQVPAGAIVNQPFAKKLITSLSGKGSQEQIEGFNKSLLDTIGARGEAEARGVSGLTPEVFEAAKQNIYKAYDAFKATKPVILDTSSDVFNKLHSIEQEATSNLGTSTSQAQVTLASIQDTRREIEDVLLKNFNHKTGHFEVDGNDFQHLVRRGGPIDELFKSNSLATPYATDMKAALYKELENSNPAAAGELKKVNEQYSNLKAMEGLVQSTPHGLISPPIAARRLGNDTGELAEKARIGHYLPAVTPEGAAKQGGGGIASAIAGHAGEIGMGTAVGGAVAHNVLESPHGVLHGLLEATPELAGLAALGLGGSAIKHAVGGYLGGPEYLRHVIRNSLQGLPPAMILPTSYAVPAYTRGK